ncbi:hypothetical protein G9A89_011423 [Geosiphon pyriformis]|nr:hypothetical protein G9A89_011423 [Geosiphon pyriformis]
MIEKHRKIEIINNIYSLAQQIFQLIQYQKMEITINQQTIQYKSTARILQHKVQRKLKNVIDKIMTKLDYTKNLLEKLGLGKCNNFQKTILKPFTSYIWVIDTVTSNQLGKMTNAQFEELQTQITQVILEKEVQKIIQEEELKELDFDGVQY